MTTPKFKIRQEETIKPCAWNIDRLFLKKREGENQQKVQWQEKLHWLTLGIYLAKTHFMAELMLNI